MNQNDCYFTEDQATAIKREFPDIDAWFFQFSLAGHHANPDDESGLRAGHRVTRRTPGSTELGFQFFQRSTIDDLIRGAHVVDDEPTGEMVDFVLPDANPKVFHVQGKRFPLEVLCL